MQTFRIILVIMGRKAYGFEIKKKFHVERVTMWQNMGHPHFGLLEYMDNSKNGVWINRLDGVRIFRPNDFEGYAHILPLEPSPNDVFL